MRCAEAGIAFEPIAFEFQGGLEPRAAAILHRIAAAVAAQEDADAAVIKKSMLERLALIIARRCSRAVRRRDAKARIGRGNQRVKRILAEAVLDTAGEFQ